MTSYAPINGLNLYYEIHGNGNPLVLIHGGGSTIRTTFGNVIADLAGTRQVIAVEMQAHGHTADIERPLTFSQDAADIASLLEFLRIPKADIFGFSNGASTALHFAIEHAAMANRIIIASTFYKRAGAPGWFWEAMSKPTFEGMPEAYKDAFLEINPDPLALRRMYERDVARMQSFTDLQDDQIASITSPALIILGDRDVVTAAHAVEMHQLIQGSRLAIIPGGHGDYIGEITTPYKPAVIASTVAMINDFLD